MNEKQEFFYKKYFGAAPRFIEPDLFNQILKFGIRYSLNDENKGKYINHYLTKKGRNKDPYFQPEILFKLCDSLNIKNIMIMSSFNIFGEDNSQFHFKKYGYNLTYSNLIKRQRNFEIKFCEADALVYYHLISSSKLKIGVDSSYWNIKSAMDSGKKIKISMSKYMCNIIKQTDNDLSVDHIIVNNKIYY